MKKIPVITIAVVLVLSVLLGAMMFSVDGTEDADAILDAYASNNNTIKRPISVEQVRRQIEVTNEETVQVTIDPNTGLPNVTVNVPSSSSVSLGSSPQGTNAPTLPTTLPKGWLSVVDTCHKYWGGQGLTYQYGGAATISDLTGKSVSIRKDCSGFVGFCLYTMGLVSNTKPCSSQGFGSLSCVVEVDKNSPEPGDILVYSGHVEIYAGQDRVWNWGSAKSAQNKYTGVSDVSGVDSTINWSRKGTQTHVYRLK